MNKMSNLNFNEFAQNCYNAAKSKGFHDNPPTNIQYLAAVKFLQIIVLAAKDFEAVRKNPEATLMTSCPLKDRESRATVRTALLATELAEAAEWCLERDIDDQTELCSCGEKMPGNKPEGFGSELADLAIRLGDMSGDLGVDLDYEIQRKLAFNATRPFKHGKQF